MDMDFVVKIKSIAGASDNAQLPIEIGRKKDQYYTRRETKFGFKWVRTKSYRVIAIAQLAEFGYLVGKAGDQPEPGPEDAALIDAVADMGIPV